MKGALLLFLFCSAPLCAQQPDDMTAGPAQDLVDFRRKEKDKEEQDKKRAAPTPVAQAVSLAFGATTWAEVKLSTAGPVAELSSLSRQGFYKLELIEMVMLSASAGKSLSETAAKRRKGKSLRQIAVEYGLDPDALYDAALAVEEVVDREYLPRFPEIPPRKENDQ